MTFIKTASIGSYPRIGEEKDQQRHRRGYAHFEKGEISAHAFHDVEQSVLQEIILEQANSNLDEITDGQITWQDPISHFCKNLSGVKLKGLARYFDTNFYYRIPEFQSNPHLKTPVLAPDYKYAKELSNRPVRAVLTGPLTLALHTASDYPPLQKALSRLHFFAEMLRKEILELKKEGAVLIQIDEPSLLRNPDHLDSARKAWKTLVADIPDVKFFLALYYGPVASIYPHLGEIPFHGINLDLTYDGPRFYEKLLKASLPLVHGFGLVNARNTKKEEETLPSALREWIDKKHPETVYLTPSAGLESLPRNAAHEKLLLLQRMKEQAQTALAEPHHG